MRHYEEMRVLEERTLALLRRYMSDPAARGVVRRARLRRPVNPVTRKDEPNSFIDAVIFGANLFVQDRARGQVEREIRHLADADDVETAGRGATQAREVVPIFDEHHARKARMLARRMAEDAGSSKLDALKAATGLSELARNILMYAGHGEVVLEVLDLPRRIRIAAIDRGPGIGNLTHVLSGDYVSRSGLGRGLLGTKKLADSFHIDTGPQGTTVTFEMHL